MCGCEPGFTCSRCAGTPSDDAYHDDVFEEDARKIAEAVDDFLAHLGQAIIRSLPPHD